MQSWCLQTAPCYRWDLCRVNMQAKLQQCKDKHETRETQEVQGTRQVWDVQRGLQRREREREKRAARQHSPSLRQRAEDHVCGSVLLRRARGKRAEKIENACAEWLLWQ